MRNSDNFATKTNASVKSTSKKEKASQNEERNFHSLAYISKRPSSKLDSYDPNLTRSSRRWTMCAFKRNEKLRKRNGTGR